VLQPAAVNWLDVNEAKCLGPYTINTGS